ncbi:hypothetical protein D3C85_1563590 [compost metagenome]
MEFIDVIFCTKHKKTPMVVLRHVTRPKEHPWVIYQQKPFYVNAFSGLMSIILICSLIIAAS